ncbi:MAG: glutamate-5-semialdehyde dehydrogenase [Okeania sp. SIO2H7]|nr:glutamate-5-semialdehyde dehydrogenase [Okeania sp. SIO2H7]
MNIENSPRESQNLVRSARQGALELAKSKASDRRGAIEAMALAIQRHQNEILEANTLDLEASRLAEATEPMVDWLKLTPDRLESTVEILQHLARLPEPVGQIISYAEGSENGSVYSQRIPLGAIALIYEAFPELAAIAAGMCLKTANSLLLLGVSGATHSNLAIARALKSALDEAGLALECVELLPLSGENSIRDLVTQDLHLSLVIPYGRPSLVREVTARATVPVLRTAIGNCYLYWSASGSLETARSMILESHKNQPDAVNAIEKVLIDPNQKSSSLARLWNLLKEKGFEIRVDEALNQEFPDFHQANTLEWSQPYLTKTVAFKVVENLDTAIAWINCYSSGHADCLATESYQESRQFALEINSASTFINESPRFHRYRHPRDSIFLGMSNQKIYPRGAISLEALTTIKQIFLGDN